MSLADRAKNALDEVTFDAHPGFNTDIDTIYEALDKLKQYEDEAAARSWQGCVDRQGGSFDQSELDNREDW